MVRRTAVLRRRPIPAARERCWPSKSPPLPCSAGWCLASAWRSCGCRGCVRCACWRGSTSGLCGGPQLLQLVFIYDALPGIGIRFNTFTTAVIGFALNEAAFSAEIIRGGILSVNRNQSLAATAFGMGPFLTMRRIVLPQAMRAILPGMANDTISMIKGTSIASVIFVNELTFRSQQIVGQNFKFFLVFAAAGVIYLVMTSAVAGVQGLLEQRFNLEHDRTGSRSMFGRMFNFGLLSSAPSPPATPLRTPHRTPHRRAKSPPGSALWRAISRRRPATTPGPLSSAIMCRNPTVLARSCAASTSPSDVAKWWS